MSDNDRLATIIADAQAHVYVYLNNTTETGGDVVVVLSEADYDWLIAHIHALEAQAAADAKVREAAEEFVSAHTHYMCANERMNGIAYMAKCDAQAALHIAVAERKAALAAWKGE